MSNELIHKLPTVYCDLNGKEKSEHVDIKTLWRWIKDLIDMIKDLPSEKEMHSHKPQKQINDYQKLCNQLIQDDNLNGIEELKSYLNDLTHNIISNTMKNKSNTNCKKYLI